MSFWCKQLETCFSYTGGIYKLVPKNKYQKLHSQNNEKKYNSQIIKNNTIVCFWKKKDFLNSAVCKRLQNFPLTHQPFIYVEAVWKRERFCANLKNKQLFTFQRTVFTKCMTKRRGGGMLGANGRDTGNNCNGQIPRKVIYIGSKAW